MFDKPKLKKPSELDLVHDELVSDLHAFGPDDPKYDARLKQLKKLNKERLATKRKLPSISIDTLVLAAVQIWTVHKITKKEEDGIISSFARNFITRTPKL